MFSLLSSGSVWACVCATLISVAMYALKHRGNKRAAFKRRENSKFASSGTQWNNNQHEYYVERFYETGLTGKPDFHGGYLNFGFWADGNTDYIKASEELLSQVADQVNLGKPSRLLDVANGMGAQDIFYFNKYHPKTIDMIDVTLSHHLICKKRIEEHGLGERLTAHYGSAVDLPFADNTFTHVISIEGGIHYRTRDMFLKEAYRVLEPNGCLSQADFAIELPTSFLERTLGNLCGKLWNVPNDNWRSCEALKKCMEEAGFVDVVVKDIGEFCIPGYHSESTRPETLVELSKIRGWFGTYVAGRILDELILYVYQKRLLTEVILSGRKPSLE